MPKTLVALTDGPDLALDKPVLLLGRHAECDIQLHSGKVSRRHCVIAIVNDELLIRDLGSTNGIRINGQRVTDGPLRDGDEVTIGNFSYRVNAGPDKTSVRKTSDEDERLEESDEPVPLNDARDSQVMVAGKPPVTADSASEPDIAIDDIPEFKDDDR